METVVQSVRPVLCTEPNMAQVSHTCSYVNDSGFDLSIHLPNGSFFNIPTRKTSVSRMVLSVYVTYSSNQLSQLNSIIDHDTMEIENVTTNMDRFGRITLRYDITDFSDIFNDELIIIPELGIGVKGGFSTANQYHPPPDISVNSLTFYYPKNVSYALINGEIVTIQGGNEKDLSGCKATLEPWQGHLDYNDIVELGVRIESYKTKEEVLKAIELARLKPPQPHEKFVGSRDIVLSELITTTKVQINEMVDLRKLEREEASSGRREGSEAMKWVPAIVTTAATLVGKF